MPQILLIEDNDDDALLLGRALRVRWPKIELDRVQSEADLRKSLKTRSCDIVLSDFHLPRFGGMQALELVREVRHDIPFIIVSGTIGEEAAVAAMRAGAQDYVSKNHLGRLVPAIERELREAAGRRSRRDAEAGLVRLRAQYELILSSAGEGILGLDKLGLVTFINPAGAAMLGYTEEELLGRFVHGVISNHPKEADPAQVKDWPIHRTVRDGYVITNLEDHFRRKDGTLLPVQFTCTPILNGGEIGGAVMLFSDNTSRQQAEQSRQMQSEMAIAAKIQRGLLPAAAPILPNLAIAGYCRQAGSIGGDGYDFVPHSAGLSLVIADVSGHGVAAALLLSNFLSLYRSSGPAVLSAGALAKRINRHFCQTVGDSGQFVTSVIAHIPPTADSLTYTALGHFPPLLQRAGVVTVLPATGGFAAGFCDDCVYEQQTVALEPGDVLLFFTDGLVEIRGRDALHFGVQGLMTALAKTVGMSPEQVLASVLDACQQYSNGDDPVDDQTAIAIVVLPRNSTSPAEDSSLILG